MSDLREECVCVCVHEGIWGRGGVLKKHIGQDIISNQSEMGEK